MALGLGRYYDVNPGTAYEHDGPGSSVVQVSHLPYSRPWLQTLGGGRSSQVNTARSSFWMDEKDALIDPSGLDAEHRTYNDVYVGAFSRGSRQLLGDDNDWYEQNPSNFASYSWGEVQERLKKFISSVDPSSSSSNQYVYDKLENILQNQDTTAGIDFLTEYANIYQTIGGGSVGNTNNIINAAAQIDLDFTSAANVNLLACYCAVAQGWMANTTTGIYSVGAAMLDNDQIAPSLYDFSTLSSDFQQVLATQPDALNALALSVVDQGTQFANDPKWSMWPSVVDKTNGNAITAPPTLWAGFLQNPDDPVSISIQDKTTGLTFSVSNMTYAQLSMNMVIFDAAVVVRALFLGVNDAMPWGSITGPATPTKGGLSTEEKVALAGVAAVALYLVGRQVIGA